MRDPISTSEDCYSSNPPTSGRHLADQRSVEIVAGRFINIPPNPDVYPPDVFIPRAAIPALLSRGGVFVGWNCPEIDAVCAERITALAVVLRDLIDNQDNRVVMAHDSDLLPGEIALAAWTRVDRFSYTLFVAGRVTKFVAAHSCRYDPEGFCR